MEEEMLKEPPVVKKISGVLNNIVDHLVMGMGKAYERKHPGEKPSYGGEGNDLDLSVLEVGDVISIHPINPPELAGLLGPYMQLLLGYVGGAHWWHTAVYAGDGKIVEGWLPKVRKVDYEILHTTTDVGVYRVKTTDEIKRKALKFCESKIGLPYHYSWMYVFTLLYPSVSHVEGDRYYCSELAWAAYKASGGPDINAYPGFNTTPPISGYAVAPQNVADGDNVELVASAGKTK